MPASQSAAFPQSPESGSQQLVRFSFPVTWSFLSQETSVPRFELTSGSKRPPARGTASELSPKPEAAFRTGISHPESPSRGVAFESTEMVPSSGSGGTADLSVSPVPAPLVIDRPSLDRWEMVIPKMTRPMVQPSKKSPNELISESSTAPSRAEVSSLHPKMLSSAELSTVAPEDSASPANSITPENSIPKESGGDARSRVPEFAFLEQPPARSSRRFVIVVGASLGALLAAGILAWSVVQEPANSKGPTRDAVVAGPALPAGTAQWTPLAELPRRISLVRDSMNLTDFRMSFQSPVSVKAAGWVFRARDSKNYYAMRLDLPKSAAGASAEVGTSTGVMERFAVIDGRDQPMTQIPVTVSIHPGATYKVTTEALGNRFTTWIADRKVDEWTDARLGNGGVGLYSDHGEPPTVVDDLAVFPLVKK